MKALKKTFDIVNYLASSGSSDLGTIAAQTGMPKSTVHHHLTDLEENGFVINNGGTYRLGFRFLDIGETTRRRTELFQIAQSEIDELAQKMGNPVTVFILERSYAVVLYTSGENPSLPTTLHPGQHLPSHATAAGKALLNMKAKASGEAFTENASMSSYTENTITEQETLEAELRQASNRGYATAEEEIWRGRCGIAVPFPSENAKPIAAVEISLTTEGFQEADFNDLAEEIKRTVNVIDIKFDYSN